MAQRVLILLTSVYPYAKGEEFLELELPHLSEAFDRVVVVATKTKPGDQLTRTVPGNVVATRAGVQVDRSSKLQLGRLALRGLAGLRPRSVLDALPHPGRVALEATFELRARQAFDELVEQFGDGAPWGIEPDAQISIYSFWLHTTARVALLLREKLIARGFDVVRTVSRAHGYDLYQQVAPLRHLPQRRLLLEGLDAVHPVSDQGSRLLRDAHHRQAPRITTQHLGVPDPGDPLTPGVDPFTVISVAYVSPVKRLDRIGTLVRGLRELGISARWVHLGTGAGDGDGLDDLRTQFSDLVDQGVVEFAGHVPHEELIATVRRAAPSLFVNLSSSEGLPVTLMEAASLGLPIVATAVGGVPEVAQQGVNAELLDADFTDQQALDVVAALAADPERLVALGQGSRTVWAQGFDEAAVYPAFARSLRG